MLNLNVSLVPDDSVRRVGRRKAEAEDGRPRLKTKSLEDLVARGVWIPFSGGRESIMKYSNEGKKIWIFLEFLNCKK